MEQVVNQIGKFAAFLEKVKTEKKKTVVFYGVQGRAKA